MRLSRVSIADEALPVTLGLSFGRLATCESRKSIDKHRFHREGRLDAGRQFSWS